MNSTDDMWWPCYNQTDAIPGLATAIMSSPNITKELEIISLLSRLKSIIRTNSLQAKRHCVPSEYNSFLKPKRDVFLETNCFNLILILLMGKQNIIFLKRIILI
jgi:hypothetical protein